MRMERFGRAVALVLLLSASGLLPGCGGQTGDVTGPAEPGSGQVVNGEWIAVQGRDAAQRLQIFLIREDGSGLRQLTFAGDNGTPAWSPDGERIAFSTNRDGPHAVWIMNKDGSDQRRWMANAQFPDWSSRDEIAYIAWGTNDPDANGLIWVARADGTGKRRLTSRSGGATATVHPSWSPDGNRLTYTLITPDPASPAGFAPEIWRIDRDGSNPRLVTITDPDALKPDGTFLQTAHDANAPDYGPDGWITFWSGIETSTGQVWKAKDDGSGRVQLTSTSFLSANDDPTWSPDGTKILFSTNRNGGNEVWIMEADGKNPRFLTKNAAVPYPGDPAWQPKKR